MASFGRVTPADPGLYGTPGEVDAEVATVRAVFDAFARRDVEAMLRYTAEDCVIDLPATGALAGHPEPYRGFDGIRAYFEDVGRVWEALELRAEDIRAASGGVVVFGDVSGRAGGQEVRRRVIWLWEVRDGKVVRVSANDLGDM
jgi:ketosteroid isomerase-like protein